MSRNARGLIGGAIFGASVLSIAILTLPLQWIIAFFATTTTLTVIALGIEVWSASRDLETVESPER